MHNESSVVTTGERRGQSNQNVDPSAPAGRAGTDDPPLRSGDHEAPPAPIRKKPKEVKLGNWWNRTRYGLYAPIYRMAAKPLERGRKRAIERLDLRPDDRVLILGSGPGIDLAHLPVEASITAIDLTPSMVRRTQRRADELGIDVDARVGDAQDLPFADGSFDAVLLHLILTVVSQPEAVAADAARVVAEDGRVSIYDKFVPSGESPSVLRRALNPLAKVLVSDLTRRLEPMIEDTDLVLGPRESFFGGLYTVTVARPNSDD